MRTNMLDVGIEAGKSRSARSGQRAVKMRRAPRLGVETSQKTLLCIKKKRRRRCQGGSVRTCQTIRRSYVYKEGAGSSRR